MKSEVFRSKVSRYSKNKKSVKLIYYILGFISTIISTAVSFFSGANVLVNNDIYSICILISSLLVVLINAILTFGEIEKKITKYGDGYTQYTSLLFDIEEFECEEHLDDDRKEFLTLLIEKEKMLNTYVTNDFCF